MSRSRAERRRLTQRHINRQIRILKYHGMNLDYPGQYHKRNALNCGVAGCNMCCSPRYSPWLSNWDKLTIPERKALENAEAQFDEIDNEEPSDC